MKPSEIRSQGTALVERTRAHVDIDRRLEMTMRAHQRARMMSFAVATAAVVLALVGVLLLVSQAEPPVVTSPSTTVPTTSPELEGLPVEVFVVLHGEYSVDEATGVCQGSGRLAGIGEGSRVEVLDGSVPVQEEIRVITLPAGREVSAGDPEASFVISEDEPAACVFTLPDLGYDIDDYENISLHPEADPEVSSGSFASGLRVVYTFRDVVFDPGALSPDGIASEEPEQVQAEIRALRESAEPGRLVGFVHMSAERSTGAPDSPAQPVCVGSGGFAGIRPGQPVVVTDQAGQVLGQDILRGSVYDGHIGCSMWFGVEVRADLSDYSIVVADHPPVSFDRDTLDGHGWQIDLWADPAHMEANCVELEAEDEAMTCVLLESRE